MKKLNLNLKKLDGALVKKIGICAIILVISAIGFITLDDTLEQKNFENNSYKVEGQTVVRVVATSYTLFPKLINIEDEDGLIGTISASWFKDKNGELPKLGEYIPVMCETYYDKKTNEEIKRVYSRMDLD